MLPECSETEDRYHSHNIYIYIYGEHEMLTYWTCGVYDITGHIPTYYFTRIWVCVCLWIILYDQMSYNIISLENVQVIKYWPSDLPTEQYNNINGGGRGLFKGNL